MQAKSAILGEFDCSYLLAFLQVRVWRDSGMSDVSTLKTLDTARDGEGRVDPAVRVHHLQVVKIKLSSRVCHGFS